MQIQNALACVASVSVWFRSKERGTRVKDREKNGSSERAGRGWERKEGNRFLPSPPFPLFYCLALVSFLALSKPKISFLGVSLLRNQTETLGTQAKMRLKNVFVSNHKVISAKRPGLKMGVKNDIFWSEIGSGFGNPPPPQEFPGVPSPMPHTLGDRFFSFLISS